MSRVGKMPVLLSPDVLINQVESVVSVSGPRGSLEMVLPDGVFLDIDGAKRTLVVNAKNSSFRGTYRALLASMVEGVTRGIEKRLSIVGVGYRASIAENVLTLHLGRSHPVLVLLPEQVRVFVEKSTLLTVSGVDSCAVGRVVALLTRLRRYDPYKGKGVLLEGASMRRKQGKTK